MAFIEHDEMIETLPADTAKRTFAHGVHVGSANRGLNDASANSLGGVVELRAELVVAIPYDEAWPVTKRYGVSQLQRRPLTRWRAGHPGMNHFARPEVDNEKCKHRSKRDVIRLQEITRPRFLRVVIDKR